MTAADPSVVRRIRRELRASNYTDGEAAIRDAPRIALFAAVEGAAKEYLTVRRATISELNARHRQPATTAPPPTAAGKQAGRLHDVLFPVAFVLAIISAGLTLPVPRSGGETILPIGEGSLISGVSTVLVFALFVWLEPYRTTSRWWPIGGVPASGVLFFAIYWIIAGVSIVWRWEPNPYEAVQVYLGMALVTASGVGAVVLWRRARRNDRAARDAEHRVAADLVDEGDVPEYLERMDAWWRRVDEWTTPDERAQVESAQREVLSQLRAAGVITEKQQRSGIQARGSAAWSEPRP